MPDEGMWEEFFKTPLVLAKMGVNSSVQNLAEFGSGYGTFTIPATRLIKGTLSTFDIDPEMIAQVEKKARDEGLSNAVVELRDFVEEGTGLKANSIDYGILFNILYAERPEYVLLEAWRILKPGGRIGFIHWNYDPSTPWGPPMEIRPKPDQCIEWAVNIGLKLENRHDLKPYHYGLVFTKPHQIE